MKFTQTGNLVDAHRREIYPATVTVADDRIESIERMNAGDLPSDASFLMPGFIDSHIHVESSMLTPDEFAAVAVRHGTVATVSDPHEIANVCGIAGVEFMLARAELTRFKFMFGAPSCVPATTFETSGASLDVAAVTRLLDDPRIGYLSEVMDFPGVLRRDPEVMAKINAAIERSKPVDGHAPGLRGDDAANYVAAGITTDHECFTLDEALDKIAAGCQIAIREGSAARNFDALESLIDSHPDHTMLCSDDKHPDEFLLGHINELAARAIANGRNLFNVIQVACLNPVKHYGLDVGTLRVGDPADFIVVNDLETFDVIETFIDGHRSRVSPRRDDSVSRKETDSLASPPNQFVASAIDPGDLVVPVRTGSIRVIEAIDGQLVTGSVIEPCRVEANVAIADPSIDLLKIVVVNRYADARPAIGFVRGFKMSSGAFASSVAHDSHNVVAVGVSDEDLAAAINGVIEHCGGMSVSTDGESDVLPLPIAGLMATGSCEAVAADYTRLDARVKSLGSKLRAPFMTLSFMALPVIPSLKLTDLGLFDVDAFAPVDLFV